MKKKKSAIGITQNTLELEMHSLKSLFMSYTVLLLKIYLVSRISKYFNWKEVFIFFLRLQQHFFTPHIILSIAQLFLYSLAFIHIKLNMSTLNNIIRTHTPFGAQPLYIKYFSLHVWLHTVCL